jgi:hypothetical protein
MPGERFDYANERQRHEKFVGREALLSRLDELLVGEGADRWVVVTGGPGMGKSAILSAWLGRREAAGAVVPHHFIRRGAYDWDDPAQMVGSLVAQIDERFPGAREPDTGARMHPAARLAKALSRVSEQELGPRGGRLVVLIDGLDEYDPPAGALPGDPLAAFLPYALPRGVSFLCASRPRHPYVSSLAARDGEFIQLDLDASDSAADNDATVRTFWGGAAGPLGLDAGFVEEAVARAGGNVQHAVQLRRHVAATPVHLRRVEDIPRGLGALIERTWERIAHDAVVVEGLGVLCAAREALTLDELGAVAAWTADATRRAFLRGAKEVLVDTRRPDGQREYRLHHEAIRAHIAQAIGGVALRGHHRALAQRLATLEGHADMVRACAVTPDGQRVVSASRDKMLKVWDLETGRALATLKGHADRVSACAVTPDGQRVVSADAPYSAVATGTAGVVAGDSAGGIWFLDWPPSDRRVTQLGVGDSENRQHESRPAQETSSSRSTMKKHTILFLGANPTGTDPLALGDEARAIQAELERSGYRDCFELETRWAAQPLDLLRELRKLKPTVVHFSGHGGLSRVGTEARGI